MVLQTWEVVTLLILGFVLIVCGIIVSIVLLKKKNWPYQVTVLEEDPKTHTSIIGYRDRAKQIPFGDGGQRIFFFKNKKKYAPDYGKRIGKNAIAFCEGADGYLYNVSLGGINTKLLEMGVTPTETSARLSNSSLRKGIENRYNDKTFFEKYGVAITIGMLIIAIIVQAGGTWINHKEANKGKSADVQIAEAQREAMELARDVLGKIDNIKSGGSGLIPAI